MIPTSDAVGPIQFSSIRPPVTKVIARITSGRANVWGEAFTLGEKPAVEAPAAVRIAP